MTPGDALVDGIEITRLDANRFLLLHPDGIRRLEVDAVGRYLINRLQGGTPMAGLLSRCRDRFGEGFSVSDFERFLAELRRGGFLAGADGAFRPAACRPRSWNRILDLAGLGLGWVFHPVCTVLLFGLLGLAVFGLWWGWGEFTEGLQALWSTIGLAEAVVLLLAIVLLAIVGPRVSLQALAVRVQGGHVDRIRIRFHHWVLPYPEVDYGDSLELMSRAMQWRILTTGLRYQVFLFSISVLGWTAWGWSTGPGICCGVLLVPSLISLGVGLLVTVKRDGYMLLAFHLKRPTLWDDARRRWREVLWGRSETAPSETGPGWLVMFGLATYLTTIIFWVLVVSLGGWLLTRRYGMPGGQLLLLGTAGWFTQPVTEAFMKTSGLGDTVKFGGRGWTPRLVRLGLVVLIGVLGFIPYTYDIVGECAIVPHAQVGVRAHRQGVIQDVLVSSGQMVAKGDPLITLSDREASATVQSAEASLAAATAQLKMLESGSRPEEIEMARQRVEIAQIRFDFLEGELTRQEALKQQGSSSAQQLERANQERDSAAMMLSLSRESLLVVEQGAREEMVDAARAEVQSATAALELARQRLQLTHVTAPIGGVVVTPHVKSRIGQVGMEGDLLVVLQDTSRLEVEVAALESAVGTVTTNMNVDIRLFALDGKRLKGTVRSIGGVVEDQTSIDANPFRSDREQYLQSSLGRNMGARAVRIRVELEDSSSVRPGMTGYARVEVRREFLWKVLGRHVLRFFRTTLWSWLP